MKLLELYSLSTGLKIKRQYLLESFYPVPTTRYITIHASSGMAAKNYPYYPEVLSLIAAILDSNGIQIVQLGAKEDPAIPGCIHLQGKTDYHQSAYILKRTLLHVGNDSWLMHHVGHEDIPILELFGSTTVKNHSPFRYNKDKSVFLESHRWGRQATFQAQEQPQTIALIPPEDVANAVLRLLDLSLLTPIRKSLSIGPLYQHTLFELVPDSFPNNQFFPQLPLTVRMDYLFNEEVLVGLLGTGRKVNVVTKQPIKVEILHQFRQSIMSYSHEIGAEDTTPLDYIRTVKTLVPKSTFFTKERDETCLAAMRFRLFDVVSVEQVTDATKSDAVNAAFNYLNAKDESIRVDIEAQVCHARVRSNKFVLSNGKLHLSHAHVKANQSIADLSQNVGDVIDDPDFWASQHHFYVYSQS